MLGNGIFYTYSYVLENDHTITLVTGDLVLFRNIMLIGACGAMGQIFIFFTISMFDCYLLSYITTSRKFITLVVSNIQFGHKFNNMQWLGAFLVIGCTSIELFTGKHSKGESKDKKTKQS